MFTGHNNMTKIKHLFFRTCLFSVAIILFTKHNYQLFYTSYSLGLILLIYIQQLIESENYVIVTSIFSTKFFQFTFIFILHPEQIIVKQHTFRVK